MSAKLRQLRDSGLEAFRDYLWKLRQNPAESPPRDLLTRQDTSQAIDTDIMLEEITPGNRYEMACYLLEKLASVQDLCQPSNAALWSWFSLYYFDLVCPVGKGGSRFP